MTKNVAESNMSYPKYITVRVNTVEEDLALEALCMREGLERQLKRRIQPERVDVDPKARYVFGKNTKDFWGSEYLNKDDTITADMIQERLTLYVRVEGLDTANGFRLDETLKRVLQTEQNVVAWYALSDLLRPFLKE